MTTKEIFEKVYEDVGVKQGLSKRQAKAFFDGMLETIANSIANEESVKHLRIGTFEKKYYHSGEREIKSVNNGQTVQIESRYRVKYRESKKLSQLINGEADGSDVLEAEIED